MTLEDVFAEANALEVVSRQLEHFNYKHKNTPEANKIETRLKEKKNALDAEVGTI